MPNPRSLPIAIDPRSFNMTASSGNCDANFQRSSATNGTSIARMSDNFARSPLWLADRQSHQPDGDLVSPLVMYAGSLSHPARMLHATEVERAR